MHVKLTSDSNIAGREQLEYLQDKQQNMTGQNTDLVPIENIG